MPDFNLCISLLDERPTANASLDEPDPLPALLPVLQELHHLLFRCRFPSFWETYRSADLESLRDNYTVELVGFEDAVREVAIRAVKATFTRIGVDRLGLYLDLTGTRAIAVARGNREEILPSFFLGSDLSSYVQKLGWAVDGNVINLPPNPDNQVEAVVVQESLKLPRSCYLLPTLYLTTR